jgi:uracil-DNA glycosylase
MTSYLGNWVKVINFNILNPILSLLQEEYAHKIVFPSQNNVFRAFNKCTYENLKIVILSQDPYFQKDRATGLSFANSLIFNDDVSPSLKIIQESIRSIDKDSMQNITLEHLASQGILLLNSSLTVIENQPGSHLMLWRPFISNLLAQLSINKTGIIYVLLGECAKTFKPYINKDTNIILEEKHPAYYARNNMQMPSTIFKQINMLVKAMYNTSIHW